MKNFLYRIFFSQPDSLGRIFWPSKEELNYLRFFSKNFLKSKIFSIGIICFLFFLISDFFVKFFIPKNFHHQIFPGFYLTNLYHSVSKIFSLLAILFLIRVLLFLRFKTYWRNNKFFDLGFGIFFGAILARIKDFSGSTDWLGIGGFVFNLIDIFYLFGLLFLIIGVIICPKKKHGYGKKDPYSNNSKEEKEERKIEKVEKKI